MFLLRIMSGYFRPNSCPRRKDRPSFQQLLAIVAGLNTAASTLVVWEFPVVLLGDFYPRHVLIDPLVLDEADLVGGVRWFEVIFVTAYGCAV